MTPLVSVCVPAFSTERFIEQTVRSVLEQTLDDLELIVVDDCSPDRTAAVVEAIDDPRLRVVRNEQNLGAVANWNKAVSLASGRYVKLVCGDDVLYPCCLEAQVTAMERGGADVVLAASPRDIIDEEGTVLIRRRGLGGMVGQIDGRAAIRLAVRSGSNPLGEPFCNMVRRDAVTAIGGFGEDFPYVIDLDYWCRALSIGDLVAVPGTAGAFRVHSGSWSHRLSTLQRAQTIALYSQLRRDHPDRVSTTDLRVGAFRARYLALSRALFYRFVAWRASRSESAKATH